MCQERISLACLNQTHRTQAVSRGGVKEGWGEESGRGREEEGGRQGRERESEGDRKEGQKTEEHTSELQSRPHISYAVFCVKKKRQPSLTRNSLI